MKPRCMYTANPNSLAAALSEVHSAVRSAQSALQMALQVQQWSCAHWSLTARLSQESPWTL